MTTEFGTGIRAGLRTVHAMAEIAPVATRPALTTDTVDASTATASWAPTLSPDAAAVAFLSDRSGAPRVWVSRRDGGDAVLLNTGFDPVQKVSWSPDGAWLACLLAAGGAARTEVWVMRPDGRDLRQVAGFAGSAATFGEWSFADSWLTVAELGDHTVGDRAMLVEPSTGQHRLLGTGDLLSAMAVSNDLRRALLRRGPRGARWLEVVDLDSGARWPLIPPDGQSATDIGHFGADGAVAYAHTDAGRDLAALVAVAADRPGGTPTVIAERSDAELEHFAISADGSTACLLWNVRGGRSDLTLLDLPTMQRLDTPTLPGDVVSGCALSVDGSRMALTAQSPTQPRTVWLVDTRTGETTPVTYPPPHLVPEVSLTPQLRAFAADDGLEVTGWLYPAERQATGACVVYLHGGPEAQERPEFHPLFHHLVAQDISVFGLNFRGSSGFGRMFLNADRFEKRFDAIADVAAAVRYLVGQGIADPRRIGCMGRSYGGYLTLAALVTYPELFAVGIDICGMADLETFFERTEPWIAAAATGKYGDPQTDRALLRELSPIHRIDRLTAPLLVVHGAHDTNVPLYEAEQVVAALEARRVPCAFLLFRDEGHEITKKTNQAFFVRSVASWLTKHLGGASMDAVTA